MSIRKFRTFNEASSFAKFCGHTAEGPATILKERDEWYVVPTDELTAAKSQDPPAKLADSSIQNADDETINYKDLTLVECLGLEYELFENDPCLHEPAFFDDPIEFSNDTLVQCLKHCSIEASIDLYLAKKFTSDPNCPKIIESMRGASYLTQEAAEHLSCYRGRRLDLSGIVSLTQDAAEHLAKCGYWAIALDGLKVLPDDVAKSLGAYGGALSLKSLTNISTLAAEKIGKPTPRWFYHAGVHNISACFFNLELDLSGLTSLSASSARRLSEYQGSKLILDGLNVLPPASSEYLSEFRGEELHLNGLLELGESAAIAFASKHTKNLYIKGVKIVSVGEANALCNNNSRLYSSLKFHIGVNAEISVEAAEVFNEFEGEYSLLGLHTSFDSFQELRTVGGRTWATKGRPLTIEAAEFATQYRGESLHFDDLVYLDDAVANILCRYSGRFLSLNGLQDISKITARALASFKGDCIYLRGLTSISNLAAIELTKFAGMIDLNGITSLSIPRKLSYDEYLSFVDGYEAAMESLPRSKYLPIANNATSDLDLSDLKQFPAEAEKALVMYKGPLLDLSGVSHLTESDAEALKKSQAKKIDLSGVGNLPMNVLDILSSIKGELKIYDLNFQLNKQGRWIVRGITSLTVNSAKFLVCCGGQQNFSRLAKLSAEVAEILSLFEEYLDLSGVRQLSVEAARMLANYNGDTLDLTGLEEMSESVARNLDRLKSNLDLNHNMETSEETAAILRGYTNINWE
jgi:hypothetical protein